MMLLIYVAIGIIILLLIALSHSEKTISLLSVAHTASYLLLSLFLIIYYKLPIFFTKGNYFFMDTLALYEVILASFIFFLASLYLRGYMQRMIANKELNPNNIKLFYFGFSLLFISTVFAFFSNNLALFWIFLELTTLFSVLLITLLNAKENINTAIQYLFIVSPAMLFSFIGLILVYVATKLAGAPSLNWFDIMHSSGVLNSHLIALSFIFVFIGFAAKSGVVPFHTWLPTTHSRAPSPVSVLLSGVVISIGMYGIIRMFAIIGQTSALAQMSWVLIIFGVLSVAVASITMLQQKNVKMLLAFSSIEQVGIILIGLGIATKVSVFWALLYMTFHSIVKSLLFFSAGVINSQYNSNELDSIKDMIKLQPIASIGLIVGGFAIIGLPPFLMFAPKLFMLTEIGKFSLILLGILLFFILIATSGFALLMTRLFSNVTPDDKKSGIERYYMPASMAFTIIILVAIVIILGFYIPNSLQNTLSSIVFQLGF